MSVYVTNSKPVVYVTNGKGDVYVSSSQSAIPASTVITINGTPVLNGTNGWLVSVSGGKASIMDPATFALVTAPAAAVAAHTALADPHPQYTTAAELAGALSGYQPLSMDLSAIATSGTGPIGLALLSTGDESDARSILNLAPVASTGMYDDLSGLPTIPPATVPGGSSGQLQANSGGAFVGIAGTSINTANVMLHLTSQGAAKSALRLQYTSGQTAPIQEIVNAAGVVVGRLSPYTFTDNGGTTIVGVSLDLRMRSPDSSQWTGIRPHPRGVEIGGGFPNEIWASPGGSFVSRGDASGFFLTDNGGNFTSGFRGGANGFGLYSRPAWITQAISVTITDQTHGSGTNAWQVTSGGWGLPDGYVPIDCVYFAHQVADFIQPIGRRPGTYSLSSNQNDYNPFGSLFANRRSRLRLNVTSACTVTGLGITTWDGLELVITNVGTANLTLSHQSASSVTGNRFLFSTGADITLAPNASIAVWYDTASARWRNQ